MIGEAEWKAHAELVGQVMLAWSRNTYQLLRVFTHITGLGSPMAETIFFSYVSDTTQRSVLLKLAKAMEINPDQIKTLKNIFKQLEKVARARNIAAHTPFSLNLFDIETSVWAPKVVPALDRRVDKHREAKVVHQLREANAKLSSIYDELDDWLVHTQYPKRLWEGQNFVGDISALGVPEPAPTKGEVG